MENNDIIIGIKDLLQDARTNAQLNEPYNDTAKRDIEILKYALSKFNTGNIPEGCYECSANKVYILSPDKMASIKCPLMADRKAIIQEDSKPNWCPKKEVEEMDNYFMTTKGEFYSKKKNKFIELTLGDRVEVWYKINNNYREHAEGTIINLSNKHLTVLYFNGVVQDKIELHQIDDIYFMDIIKNNEIKEC